MLRWLYHKVTNTEKEELNRIAIRDHFVVRLPSDYRFGGNPDELVNRLVYDYDQHLAEIKRNKGEQAGIVEQ